MVKGIIDGIAKSIQMCHFRVDEALGEALKLYNYLIL